MLVAARAGSALRITERRQRAVASAAYEHALSTLTRLAGEARPPPRSSGRSTEYRAFSLYALGRTREAETIAESIIRKDPMTKLGALDASPRLEQMFSDVRKRLLPSLIRDRFRTARSALDQKNLAEAEPLLIEARQMITEAEKLGVSDGGSRLRRPECPGRWIPRAGPIHGCATDIHASGGQCSPGCGGDTFSSLGGDSS